MEADRKDEISGSKTKNYTNHSRVNNVSIIFALVPLATKGKIRRLRGRPAPTADCITGKNTELGAPPFYRK